jgi:hypothetical protein
MFANKIKSKPPMTVEGFLPAGSGDRPFNERGRTSMSQEDKYSEALKLLLDQWNVDLEAYEQLREDGRHPLMDLKQTLENSWTIFERRFVNERQ